MIRYISLLLFIGLAFILLFSSCASVAIQVVDSEGKPIDELELELQNNEGNTIAIATPEGGGIYKISKNDISSDSFFVAIKSTDEYFPLEKRLSTSEKTNKLKLEDRMTAIVGYVLSDTEDTTPLGNCRVSTFPETIEATTDNTGKFLLKSEQFEKIEYTVYINKPYYMEGSTTFTPRDNEVVTLHQNIYLKPIEMGTLGPIVGPITPPRGGDPVTDGSPVAKTIQDSIINLLKEKEVKMSASDIGAHLKHQNVDELKEILEKMNQDGEISRTANYRYFILTEEKKKPKAKKASAPKSEAVDIEKELAKYKDLLDKGIITQEEYDTKRKQILGL